MVYTRRWLCFSHFFIGDIGLVKAPESSSKSEWGLCKPGKTTQDFLVDEGHAFAMALPLNYSENYPMTTRSLFSLAALPLLLAGTALTAQAQSKDSTTDQQAVGNAKTAFESAFKRADTNGDGKISREEAAKLPGIAARFDELDKNKDGVLTPDELSSTPKSGQ